MPKKIDVTELVLRDAHQSLMATRMAMEDMVPACEDIDQAGYWSVECWGGATFDSCIRFLNEDPWERLRTFRKLMPNTRLQMLLRGQNLLGYRHYEDTVVDRFVDKAAENGMDVFRVFDALNDIRNLRAVDRRRPPHRQARPGDHLLHRQPAAHRRASSSRWREQLMDLGCDSICIKDMAALLKPQPAYDIVKGIKEACGEETRPRPRPLHHRRHAGQPDEGHRSRRRLRGHVDQLAEPGTRPQSHREPGGDARRHGLTTPSSTRQRLLKIKEYFAKIRPRYAEFLSNITGVETEIFDSQIPGGMISNMESQLKQQGAGDRMKEVLHEVPKVRKDAGYPPLVTPSSQIVGTQAVFNVLMGRYKVLTGEFADLMLGYYGETHRRRATRV